MKRRRDWVKGGLTLAVLLLSLVLAGSVACNPFGGGEPEVSQRLVEVVRGDLAVSVSGSGNIDVSNEVRLAFGSGGKVEKIYVDEDDKVSQGDVLAKLDTSSLELALTQAQLAQVQAKAAREQAAYDLSYLEEIARASSDRIKVAESQLEAAEAQLEAAKEAVAEAQKQLDEATITAPFDGIVASVDADEGDVIPPPTMAAQTIIHLIDPASIEVIAEVDEIDIPGVKLNQKAIIEIDALPDVLFEGKVISISPMPLVESGVVSYEVKIDLDVPQDSELKVGMSADADIIIDERSDVLLVPSRAIKQDSQGNPIVKIIVDEQIEERPVVIGISDGYQTEIVDGLDEGETVVVEIKSKT